MVAPAIATKAAKDALDKKQVSHAFDKTVKILNLVFMFLIVVALFILISSFLFGFPFSIGNSGSVYTNSYTEKIIKDYSSDSSNKATLNPFFTSGIPQDGCYLAYICPGVPNTCDNKTCTDQGDACTTDSDCCAGCCQYSGNGISKCVSQDECQQCKDYAQTCTSNESCCSGCCKAMIPGANYMECRLEGECGQSCYQENYSCMNDSQCCSGCCVKGATSNYGFCKSAEQCKTCVTENRTCVNNSDCCDGLTCKYGTCKPDCIDYAFECSSNSDCCSDCCKNMGGDHKECRFSEECCSAQNETCSGNSDCCDGLTCQNRKCQPECLDLNEPCSPNNPSACCSGCCQYTIGQFQCLPEASCSQQCSPHYGDCKTTSDCCSNLYCNANFTCTCVGYLSYCNPDMPCCDGYTCSNGYCTYPV